MHHSVLLGSVVDGIGATNAPNNLFHSAPEELKVSIFNVFIGDVAAAVVIIVACSSKNLGFYWTRRRGTCNELLIKFFSASSSSSCSFQLFPHSPRSTANTRLGPSTYVRFAYLLLSSLEIHSPRFFFSSFFASIFIDGM